MSTTYPAVLTRDGFRWLGDAPPELSEGQEVRVDVVVKAPRPLPKPGADGADLVRLMDQLADTGAFDGIEDPAAWVRKQRSLDRE